MSSQSSMANSTKSLDIESMMDICRTNFRRIYGEQTNKTAEDLFLKSMMQINEMKRQKKSLTIMEDYIKKKNNDPEDGQITADELMDTTPSRHSH